MFGEAGMAELWEGMGKAAMAGTHKAQELLGVMSSMDPHMISGNL
jgi:hypothetical protein